MNLIVRSLSFGIGFASWCCSLPLSAASPPVESPVRINEWMASNQSIPDEAGEFGAWIELFNGGDSAITLSGWSLTDNLAKPAAWALPAGTVLQARRFYLVWADGKNRFNHTDFRLASDAGVIGLYDPSGALRDCIQYGPQATDVSQGRYPDGAATIQLLARPTPAGTNDAAPLPLTASARGALSPAGAIWSYYDRGEDLGTLWREAGYNDANWMSGQAQFGFGDNDEVTVINGGPIGRRHITTYFRRTFFATNTALLSNLTVRLLRDDAAVVYLNGVEIRRDNLPASQILYSTFASSEVTGADETNYLVTPLPSGRLIPGNNVLAVEVHQSGTSNSDLSFDLELSAAGSLPGVISQPGFISVPPGACVEFQAPAVPSTARFQWLRNNRFLPGETSRTLQLCGVEHMDGGAYGLLIFGINGRTTVVNPTALVVTAPSVFFNADLFNGAMFLFGLNGVVQGNNVNASREAGEPFHHGTAGGRSMWFNWMAPSTGIATFDTSGSSIDTLLAVYSGLSVSNLTPVVSDDEHGDFSAGRVSFNAQANVTYRIAVDGFEGAAGYFTLRWGLEATAATIPTIFAAPESETVRLGEPAVFTVGVDQPNATYQWLRNGQIIPNETRNRLLIPAVTTATLGDYSVRVGSGFGRAIESDTARLVFGDCARFYDRPYVDLKPCRGALSALSFVPAGFNSTNPPSAGIPGTIGIGGFLYGEAHYPSTGTHFECDGVTIQSPQFYDLQITDDGLVRLDTCGSGFPAVLALYHKAPERFLDPTYRIAYDLVSAGLNQPAMVTAQVSPGVYTVVVGRLTTESTASTVRLNERLGPSLFLASKGAPPLQLKVNTNRSEWASSLFTSFRWFKDGNLLASTAGPSLKVGQDGTGLQVPEVGTYTLLMTNPTRRTLQLVADVILTNEPSVDFRRLRGGLSNDDGLQRMELEARSNVPMWIDSRAPVVDTPMAWTPLARWVTNYHAVYIECGEPIHDQRYLRRTRILEP